MYLQLRGIRRGHRVDSRDVITPFFSGVGIGVAFMPQEVELELVE